MHFKISSLIIVFIVSSLLAACASPMVATELAHPTETPQPSLTSTPEHTPTETPVPLVEPVLPELPSAGILPVTPPDFEKTETPEIYPFDFSAAHAIYALYRQQEGPAMWTDEADFIADMATYADQLENQGIEIEQASVESQTFSLLVRGNEILLNFDDSGNLKDSDPGRWSKESTPEWVDVGGAVELFISEDGHAYIAKVDADDNVIAFLNAIGANRDNLDQQWIEVQDGQAVMTWDAQKGWVENPLFAVPEDWQGKIDHIETLSDGRTVAIAIQEDQNIEPVLRALQLDNSGKWIPYEPQVAGLIPIYEEFYGRSWQESLPIPEIRQPLTDSNGEQFPIGYLGKVLISESPPVERLWVSGIIAGAREIPEQKCTEFVIAFQLPNGDFQYSSYLILNFKEQSNMIGTHLSRMLDASRFVAGEYTFRDLIIESSSQIILGKNPPNMVGFANYLLKPELVGTQIAIALNASPEEIGHPDSIPQWRLINIIRGLEEATDNPNHRQFYAWMIPQSMEEMLDY